MASGASMGGSLSGAPTLPAPPAAILPIVLQLTTVEVKQLWWFLDGAIMSPEARHRLWAAWGFCPRHTWAHFTCELELRALPRGTIILYEDLLGRAARPARNWVAQLRTTGPCLTCDYLAVGDATRDEQGWAEETAVVNRHERTLTLLQECQVHWEPRTCPACLGGAGMICRPHLLEDGGKPTDRDAILATLNDLRRRVEGTGAAISWPRRTVLPREWAAVVETLGWFAGWDGLRAILPARH
jgi:hypothetical protein